MRIRIGQSLLGRFTLLRQLGHGGMAVVWLAHDEQLGEEVALKFLPDALRWDPIALADLKAETRRARSLTHPNIVRIHDLEDDGTHTAIAMEFVDGQTLHLARKSRPGGVFEPADILAWLAPLCAALDYAHLEARVVHRDLKPSNLMLTAAGTIKVTDFGIARNLADTVTRSGTGLGVGTLAYMSPQQQMGEPPSPADDIYALGATLYDLLTGKPPFFSGNIAAQLHGRPPDSLAGRRRTLGVASPTTILKTWEDTLAACLAKDPGARPRTAGEVAERLGAYNDKLPRRPNSRNGNHAAGAANPRVVRWFVRPKLALAATATACLGVAGWWWLQPSATAPTPSPPAEARNVAEFVEDFRSGLGGWHKWGEPQPRLVTSYQGRNHVLDTMGDGIYDSGLTSLVRFSAPHGLVLETDVYLNLTNPDGNHLLAAVGLTEQADAWMDPLGSTGDSGLGLRVQVHYTGPTTWGAMGSDRRGRIWASAFFRSEHGQVDFPADDASTTALVSDGANRWITLRAVVAADRRVALWIDDRHVWSSEEPIDPRVLTNQRLVIAGRSAGLAGKAYHSSVRLRPLAPDSTLHVATSALKNGPRATSLPWTSTFWSLGESDLAGRLLTVAASERCFVLASSRDHSPRWVSHTPADDAIALNLELQPLLQSTDDGSDTVRIGFVSAAQKDGRFVGMEFSRGQIWLVDAGETASADKPRVRLGTFASGQWLSFSLRSRNDRHLAAVGSQVYFIETALEKPLPRPWLIALEAHRTSDGALLRPMTLVERRAGDAKP